MKWEPIDKAPKDGTEFQAWVTNCLTSWWEPRCKYNEDGTFLLWDRNDYDSDGWVSYSHLEPTHYMPQPGPPEKEQCREDGRCQYAIDHDAEKLEKCPDGQCQIPSLKVNKENKL